MPYRLCWTRYTPAEIVERITSLCMRMHAWQIRRGPVHAGLATLHMHVEVHTRRRRDSDTGASVTAHSGHMNDNAGGHMKDNGGI